MSLLASILPHTAGLPIFWWVFWWLLIFVLFPVIWWWWFYRGVRHDRNFKRQIDRILVDREHLEHTEPAREEDDAYR